MGTDSFLVHLCMAYSVPMLQKCLVRGSGETARSQPARPALPAALAPAGGKGTVPVPVAQGTTSLAQGGKGSSGLRASRGKGRPLQRARHGSGTKKMAFPATAWSQLQAGSHEKSRLHWGAKWEEVACLWGCSGQGRDFI